MTGQPVVLNVERSRFELDVDDHTAFIEFVRDGDTMTLTHTDVPEILEGRGIGTELVRGALAYIREHSLSVVPQCPFVRSYLKGRPDDAKSLGLDPSGL